MTGRLRPYDALDEMQQRAIDALYNNDEQLALLETGFGKTVVAMTAGEELRRDGVIKRPIVFAPLRVAQNTWPAERTEWAHLRNVPMVEWGGAPEDWADSLWKQSRVLYGQRLWLEQRLPKVVDVIKRREMGAKLAAIVADERNVNTQIRRTDPPEAWHVTSFENIEWFCDLYAPGESPFDLWVVDETGRVARNPKSPRYKALKAHMPKAKIRWGLNATPAPEGCEDLFGQVQIVCGKHLWGSSFYQWRQRYFVPADYMGYSWRLQLGAFDLLMRDLNSVAFRAPATAYTKNATVREIEVDLPPKARSAYEEMAKTMAVELAALQLGDDLDPVVAMSEAAAAQKLRQLTQGYLYEVDADGRRTVHHIHDEKTEALAELIDSMGREPLLVCYQFDQDLENIRKIFKNVPYIGQGVAASVTTDHIDRWNKRELPVLALHPNCLHPNTLVLTEQVGWKKLIDVRANERVFDGVEFVSHQGCQLSGVRAVIERFGLVMTPDHRILINNEWVKAGDVRDTGSARREARYTYQGDDARLGALFKLRRGEENTRTERGQEQQRSAEILPSVLVCCATPHDTYTPVPDLAWNAGSDRKFWQPQFQSLRWARDYGRSKLAKISELLARYARGLYGRFDHRTDRREWPLLQGKLPVGDEYGAAGEQAEQPDRRVPRPADALLGVLPGSGGDEGWDPLLSQPVRNGRRSDGSVLEIDLPEVSSEPEGLQIPQAVYDLVDCGPRHQFVVRNAAGECFVVHNSASHGLNLQYGGHHVAWLALPWSLDGYKQTIERLDRRGQTQPVYSHHILARDTIDQKVSAALVEKDDAQNRLIAAIRRI